MKYGKSKILSIVGIVAMTVVSTLISTKMQDMEIEKNVSKHFDEMNKTQESNEEEA